MAERLFVDTWGWLTLHDKAERHHQVARQVYQNTLATQGQLYTTDYVLDETITLLFRRLPPQRAGQSMNALLSSFDNAGFHLIPITEDRFAAAQTLRSRFLDKPLISFTDLTSMVVMQELNILMILTEDKHFTVVGMSFQRVPSI